MESSDDVQKSKLHSQIEKSSTSVEIEKPHSQQDSPLASEDETPAVSASQPTTPRNAAGQPIQLQGWRLVIVALCVCFGLLLSVMESSIVSTALITIATDFNDFIKVSWVVQAYLLTYMGFAVIISRISDVVGRKWAVAGSFIIFSVFSLGCGLAQSLLQLIILRAFQGVGGSGLYAMTMVTLPEITPKEKLALMSSAIGAVFTLSSVLGPVLGGVITTQGSWRWCFLLNVPAGAVIFTILYFVFPSSYQSPTKKVKWKQVDFGGALLLLAASVLLVFGLEEGGAAAFAWNSATIIATLVVASCCWVGFTLWMWLLSSVEIGVKPIFSPRILKSRVMAVVIINTLLVGYSYFSVLIQLPERFQIVNLNTAQDAGLKLLPLLAASALGSFLGGFLSSKKDRTFYTLMAANSLILLGCGLLSSLPDQQSVVDAQYGYQVIFGLGVGLTFSSVTVMTSKYTEPADTAVAQGAVAQARVFGGSLGLSAATIIFNSKVVSTLGGVLSPSEIDALRKSLTSVHSLTLRQQLAVVSVFAEAFNQELRVCTYLAAACFVVSLFAFQKNPPDYRGGRSAPKPSPAESEQKQQQEEAKV